MSSRCRLNYIVIVETMAFLPSYHAGRISAFRLFSSRNGYNRIFLGLFDFSFLINRMRNVSDLHWPLGLHHSVIFKWRPYTLKEKHRACWYYMSFKRHSQLTITSFSRFFNEICNFKYDDLTFRYAEVTRSINVYMTPCSIRFKNKKTIHKLMLCDHSNCLKRHMTCQRIVLRTLRSRFKQ